MLCRQTPIALCTFITTDTKCMQGCDDDGGDEEEEEDENDGKEEK